ncbi:hypothetical protein EDB83DRAFT_2459851, partial [Lactarius deliciosus]
MATDRLLDICNKEQITECVRHTDIVYNFVGRDYETNDLVARPLRKRIVLTLVQHIY